MHVATPLDRGEVRWKTQYEIPARYGLRSFLAWRLTIGFFARMRPRTLVFAVIAAILITLMVTAIWTSALFPHVTIRWIVTVGGIAVILMGFFGLPSVVPMDSRSPWRFTTGQAERAAVIGARYLVTNHERTLGFPVQRVRRVRRSFGVAALQFDDGKWATVPEALFPTAAQWRQVIAASAERAP